MFVDASGLPVAENQQTLVSVFPEDSELVYD